MDISYCGDKTGFPRPGHIFAFLLEQQYSLVEGPIVSSPLMLSL